MRAPRMRVALLGVSALADHMAGAGHTVTALQDPAEAADFDMVLLGSDAARVPALASLLETYVRPGLIVAHECLELGVQVLDELEVRGAVVISFGRITPRHWAVTCNDELSGTIGELLVGEAGANAVPLTDAERGPLAARVLHAAMLRQLADAAEADFAAQLGEDLPLAIGGEARTAEVASAWKFERDPGRRRFYVELARRLGETRQRDDLEMWALQAEHHN